MCGSYYTGLCSNGTKTVLTLPLPFYVTCTIYTESKGQTATEHWNCCFPKHRGILHFGVSRELRGRTVGEVR